MLRLTKLRVQKRRSGISGTPSLTPLQICALLRSGLTFFQNARLDILDGYTFREY